MSFARDDKPGSGFSSGCAIAAAIAILIVFVAIVGFAFLGVRPGPGPLIPPEAGSATAF